MPPTQQPEGLCQRLVMAQCPWSDPGNLRRSSPTHADATRRLGQRVVGPPRLRFPPPGQPGRANPAPDVVVIERFGEYVTLGEAHSLGKFPVGSLVNEDQPRLLEQRR